MLCGKVGSDLIYKIQFEGFGASGWVTKLDEKELIMKRLKRQIYRMEWGYSPALGPWLLIRELERLQGGETRSGSSNYKFR